MKTLLSTLSLSLVALFSVACAVSPGPSEAVDGPSEETTVFVSESAHIDEQNLVCPAAGTCAKASTLCGPGNEPWCEILRICRECEDDLAVPAQDEE
jgi:hypothetical protein